MAALHRGNILASHPAALGSILGIVKNFSLDVAEIYSMMLRTVDRGLIMTIGPIS